MNGKALLGMVATLSLGLAGCGQGYTPTPAASVPGVVGGGDVFGGGSDTTAYHTASYQVLRYTLTNTMNLGSTIQPGASTTSGVCNGQPSVVTSCPEADPVGFIDSNTAQLGVPVYNADDPLATQAPGPMTSAGFKVWDIAATSACGRMVSETGLYKNGQPVLFPDGDVTNFNTLYVSLLGRMPTTNEVARLHTLQSDMATTFTANGVTGVTRTLTQAQGAAACGSVLGSLEFLTAN